MSTIARNKANWLLATSKAYPHILDALFVDILLSHGMEQDAKDYIKTFDGSFKPEDYAHITRYVNSWALVTRPADFYSALEIKEFSNKWHDLTSLNYFTRVKKELSSIAKAINPEPFYLVMFNGRVDKLLASKQPGYIPTRVV